MQDARRERQGKEKGPRQHRPSRSDLVAYFPPETLKDRPALNAAICPAQGEGRLIQREIGNHLGLHFVTVSCIVRAKEAERRNGTP